MDSRYTFYDLRAVNLRSMMELLVDNNLVKRSRPKS